MWMKKLLAYCAAGLLMAGLTVMPVSAHGHHAQAAVPADQVCGLCTYADCVNAGLHTHDNQTYCGYNHECGYCDGSCGAVGVCTVEGCAETGYHVHDQQTYCGYDHGCGYCDGSCGVVGICGVEGCTQAGRHVHGEQTYCGAGHSNGYCDNSCVRSTAGQGSGQRSGYGHHGHRGHHGR